MYVSIRGLELFIFLESFPYILNELLQNELDYNHFVQIEIKIHDIYMCRLQEVPGDQT